MSHVETILGRIDALPTLSPVAARLLAVSGADDADFDEIIGLIEADPTLTARLLSLCRRAATGAAQPVSTVRRAAVLLGLEAVQAAVLSVQVLDLMRAPVGSEEPGTGAPQLAAGFDAPGFWRHALAVACAAEHLAECHKPLRVNPGEAFTAGLLHDLGKLSLAWVLPRSYARVLHEAQARRADLGPIEAALLGIDHHLAGKRLGEHWGLPHALLDPMWLHAGDEASIATVRRPELVRLVSAADALARELHIGWSGSCGVPVARTEACARAGLPAGAAEEAARGLHARVARRADDLGLDSAGEPALVLDSLARANTRLSTLHAAAAARAGHALVQARVLGAVEDMARSAGHGGPLDVLARLAAALDAVAGPGEAVALHQPGPHEPWTALRLGRAGAVLSAGTLATPCPHLRSLAGDGGIGDAATLVNFLAAHLPASFAEVEVRSLRPLWLLPVQPADGAALLLHDRAVAPVDGRSPLAPLAAVAAAALAAAGVADGSRRLGERLAAANAQLAREQAERSRRESMARLGELSAGAAHEMNNPLTAISARAQAMLGRLTTPKDRDDASAIAEAAVRLTDLVSTLHDLARPPAAHVRACRLADVLAEGVRLGRAKARPAPRRAGRGAARVDQFEVNVQMRPAGTVIDTDPALLARALAELVANAIEAGPGGGGSAEHAVRVVAQCGGAGESREVVISVFDGGPGLSDHALRHAFDPFYSEKPAGRQAGLGLPVCRALVERLGGGVSLNCGGASVGAAARGTCAEIRLGAGVAGGTGPVAAQSRQVSGHDERATPVRARAA